MDKKKLKQLSDLFRQFGLLSKHFKEFFKANLKNEGISISYDHAIILMMLHEKQGITQIEISKKLAKDPASSSRMLHALENNNLVYKKRIGKNNKLYLTPTSYEIVQKIKPIYEKSISKFFASAHDQELIIVKDVFNRILG